MQQHAARRLHYDLRLEWRGVLLSWAVPKGPSLDPAEKRLAVQVEDHPLEYADFEGVIPEGNYGAGRGDRLGPRPLGPGRGSRTPASRRGKLLFDLEGYKLRGRFTLVRHAEAGKQAGRRASWLLIKKPDAWASDDAGPARRRSVLSGLTLDELRDGSPRLERLRARSRSAHAPRRDVSAAASCGRCSPSASTRRSRAPIGSSS